MQYAITSYTFDGKVSADWKSRSLGQAKTVVAVILPVLQEGEYVTLRAVPKGGE